MVQIVSVHVNPADSHLLLTASNDHTARITDMRCVSSQAAASSSGAHPVALALLLSREGCELSWCVLAEAALSLHCNSA